MNSDSLIDGVPNVPDICCAYLPVGVREIVAECIEDYCGKGASGLLSQRPDTFKTAPLWDDAGVCPPPEIALVIELLHRAFLQDE